jgi:hypothetical protein
MRDLGHTLQQAAVANDDDARRQIRVFQAQADLRSDAGRLP